MESVQLSITIDCSICQHEELNLCYITWKIILSVSLMSTSTHSSTVLVLAVVSIDMLALLYNKLA